MTRALVLAVMAMFVLLSPAAAQEADWCRVAIEADAAGDKEMAVEAYGKCLDYPDIAPEMRGMLLHQQALALDELGRHEEAIEGFTAALPMVLEPEKTFGARGMAHAQLGRYDDAIYDFTQAINAAPEEPAMYWMRAIMEAEAGDREAALADYDRSIELDPANVMTLAGRAELKARNGDHEGAIADYGLAMDVDPRFAPAYNGRAWHRFLSETDYEAALADIEIGLALLPDDTDFVDTKAHLLSATGETDEAYELFLRAAELGGPERIQLYEEELAKKGYFDGEPDGEIDDDTRAAFRACVDDDCRLLADLDLD